MLDRRKSDARQFANYELEVRKGKTTYKETFEE